MHLKNNLMANSLFSSYNKALVAQNKSINKISSGVKINSSKDNPIGMQKSESLRTRIRTLEASQRNVQEAVSFIQTIDGTLNEVSQTLNQIKELTIQSKNGVLDDNELKNVQDQINEHIKFIEDSMVTQYNGKDFLSELSTKEVVVGDQTLQFPKGDLTNEINELKTIDVTDTTQTNIDKITKALDKVNSLRVDFGAVQNSLEVIYNTNEVNLGINQTVESSIRDTDLSLEIIEYSKESMLVEARMSMMAQIKDIPQNILDTIAR